MRIGVITGSGSYDWPHLEGAAERTVVTEHGAVTVTEGRLGGAEIVQLSRHGTGHHRLSSQVDHKANLAALLAVEAEAVVSFTVCGSLEPDVRPGSLVVFDDLYFPANRLPDGTPCTWYDTPGGAGRGHWIFDRPFSEPLRQALITAADQTGVPVATQGVYGHVDGPRFNTRPEVAPWPRPGSVPSARPQARRSSWPVRPNCPWSWSVSSPTTPMASPPNRNRYRHCWTAWRPARTSSPSWPSTPCLP